MKPQVLEGSQAVAQAVGMCRPQVIAAYPITPQTHIVERLSKLVADKQLECEYVSVESEFSAASVVLGAAASGVRAYTATSSQGILLMSEVLYNIAGLRIPAVLTCANRAVSAPLSIWNDQQDSMAVRDSGWIQLYCASNQEAVDTSIQAFRIAERCEIPVMVCVDGFVLTHTQEPVTLPDPAEVDAFLPPYSFERRLDTAHPLSHGMLVTPEYFTEVRYAHHQAMLKAQQVIEEVDAEWAAISGRRCGGLIEATGPAEAEIGILAMGSVLGTLYDAAEENPELAPVRILKLRAFRPFPVEALKQAVQGLKELVVLERALSPGAGGIVAAEVRAALSEMQSPPRVHAVAAGLGGRDIPLSMYERLIAVSQGKHAERFGIIDVDKAKLADEDR
ncbi:MAG TPA: hypothetical protein VNI58_10370 [Mariprofundaceae bacterium]|nr:hypothetical protein [Mariprofundaceae bacterium]